ncbi:MAG: hypothetical protein E7358_06900 [Clostridiales bacterium]|nr:hypothetical protein [Clostridiales bacterium]
MKTNVAEKEIVNFFLRYYESNKFYFIEEVPVFVQSVDVVKVSKKFRTITAIEFKTNKWEKAIQQVLAEALVFDYLEISILQPKRTTTCQRIEEKCQQYGIGLYYVNIEENKVVHRIKPVRNKGLWPTQRKATKKYLEERIKNDGKN